MLSNAKFAFYSLLFQYGSNNLMMLLSLLSAFTIFYFVQENILEKLKAFFLVIITAMAAFFGARILHVVIERPELLDSPNQIFTKFDGMTFNGSLLFGFLTFFFVLKIFKKTDRKLYWDAAAVTTALSYAFMRIGCFNNGCCWGKISGVSWSVKYFDSKVMPWQGIPVHPVQLYDSILGFLIFFLLISLKLKKKEFEGRLFPIFIFIYAIGRFFTEFYRGDSFRGENLLFSLSTSQLISVGIVCILLIWYFAIKWNFNLKKTTPFVGILIFLTGCLPQEPKNSQFRSVSRGEFFDAYQTFKQNSLDQKNVIFIAIDENIQNNFSQILKTAYKTDSAPKLEDIVFWEYVKNMEDIYNIIVRIPPEKVNFKSTIEGLKFIESLGKPYDLIILTHGFPNHLSTGKGYFFSYKEVDELRGQLNNLNLVMLQSCFGETLARDFKEAGAKYVMSYPDFNRNFFFFGFFLKYYYPGTSVESAYQLTKDNFNFQLSKIPYDQIANILLLRQNQTSKEKISKTEFVRSMPAPVLE